MANLIDITNSILAENTISFDLREINNEDVSIPIEDAKFGILNFKAVTCNENTSELDLLFVIDCSGSMSDICSDNRTKMQHIIHTLKNMIMFFHERPNIKVNITVNAFDTKIYKIINRTKITKDNFTNIIDKIDKISPRGSTNIEFALQKSAEEILKLKNEYPRNSINHIFMTDGEATDGSKDINVLQNLIDSNVTNSFIGFGIDHDDALLNGICSVNKSAYYFIDKLESAGLVYGEILHSIVYKLLTDVEINIENGLIYNYKNNTWEHTLHIGDIVSESNKTFNIATDNIDECKVNIKGTLENLVILFPSTLIENSDLSIHIYRQRTLQLLYDVNQFIKHRREIDIENSYNFFNRETIVQENLISEKQNNLKLKMKNLIEEIKTYMTDNNLNDNKILKNLCDDIYICYRTFGTRYGSMFCTARQTSQGTQRQYTVSNTNEITENLYGNRQIPGLNTPTLRRQTNNIYRFSDENLTDDEPFDLPELSHTISNFQDTPYLTPQATQVMREISRGFIYNNDELDDEHVSVFTQEII